MDTTLCAQELADPMGTVGMMYYFDKGTSAAGKEIDLDVVSFYALGRGGVLGDIPAEEVDDIFFFFKTGAITAMYGGGRAKQTAEVGARAHLEAADDYARRTFGGVPTHTLEAFNEAAAALIATLPTGRWPIYDGYRAFEMPSDTAARAMRYSILLRELRGGVHTDAVKDAGLTPAEACFLDRDGAYFALHGFQDDDKPTVTDELRERRLRAESDTTARMATLLGAISADQRAALVAGAAALNAALADPQPVN
jgi:hypothetical protein